MAKRGGIDLVRKYGQAVLKEKGFQWSGDDGSLSESLVLGWVGLDRGSIC